ncbi:MAG: Transcriptional regulator, GntR family [Collimonas fungivorans]|uniref:GntR family transcriptional regulator n=1 Tax=Collimonas fungivorans TaxID=158899 RepID=UPI0026EA51AF|nr:GntR family transcriptional regulator [Collimonas fungivorans]MDB5767065.1 Transcriptional regulator, GntR family [Collimonas fungivorans]
MSAVPRDEQAELSNDEIDARIHLAIIDAILDHQLPPGTRLVEAPLCEAFGVTRGTLRRVFVKLAHERVIDLQPNRGAVIAMHDVKEAREVFEARVILEGGSVKSLAGKRKVLPELRALVKREHALREQGNWGEWIRLSGEFHIKLSEANQNNIVSAYLRTLIARTSLLIGLYETPKRNSCSADEHGGILDAIEQGDAERAARLMEHHLGEYATELLTETSQPKEVDFATLFSPVRAA